MLEDIKKEYIIFCDRLNAIKEYINLLDSEKNFVTLTLSDEELKENEKLTDIIQSIKNNVSSQVTYNAIIISLYSCYENFIDSILIKYLELISQLGISYDKLPPKIMETQQYQIGLFLSNPQRYGNLGFKCSEVIENFNDCLKENDNYVLNTKLLITHSSNLGLKSLRDVFNQIGITDSIIKIKKNDNFIKYYMNEKSLNRLEAEEILLSTDDSMIFYILEDLVNRRNEIAHSWNEFDRLSIQTLKDEYINFFFYIGEAIKNIIITEIYSILFKNNLLDEFTTVHDVYNNEIVCLNNENQIIKNGGYIFCVNGENYQKALEITNIQINNQDIECVTESNKKIGIKVNGYIKINNKFYYYKDYKEQKET